MMCDNIKEVEKKWDVEKLRVNKYKGWKMILYMIYSI